MTVLTNICIHCGKKKEDHFHGIHMMRGVTSFCGDPDDDGDELVTTFLDSGLHRLHENSVELFEAVSSLTGGVTEEVFNSLPPLVQDDLEKLESIISKITAL